MPSSPPKRIFPKEKPDQKQSSLWTICLLHLHCTSAGFRRSIDVSEHGSDRLIAFERGNFSLLDELKSLGEGGIQDLQEQLSSDNKECSEKIKRLLHQHYRAFISASKVLYPLGKFVSQFA